MLHALLRCARSSRLGKIVHNFFKLSLNRLRKKILIHSFLYSDSACDIWSLGVIMYILCCGYPPFYSTHGQPISPGMKKKIRAGEYTFPDAEWKNVSQEAKDLIKKMLDVNPERRINIKEVFNSNWISVNDDAFFYTDSGFGLPFKSSNKLSFFSATIPCRKRHWPPSTS